MPPKRKSIADPDKPAAKRNVITMETKVEIIMRSERGQKSSLIGKALGLSRSTIGTILKDKVRIMEHVKTSPLINASIITKRSGLIMDTERLLLIWLEDQRKRNIPHSLAAVQEKARNIFNSLKVARIESEGSCDEEFVASKCWFKRLKIRVNMRIAKKIRNSANADISTTEFPILLKKIIDDGGYLPEQVFNVDESGLLWKKMPEGTYISKEENSTPGNKFAKDRLTLMLGCNASGDFKLKPLLVYSSENPRSLRHIIKGALPVIWKSNLRAWVTFSIFEDWFLNYFIPSVERYCIENKIPFKILLVLDNASRHPASLDDLHPNVKVVFLPPSDTYLLQPMDQGAVSVFRAYYLRNIFAQAISATEGDVMTLREFWKNYNIHDAIKNIADSWEKMKQSTMKKIWKKLCPHFCYDFHDFLEEDLAEAIKDAVHTGNSLQLDINENDVINLLESHPQEFTNEDLMEIERELKEAQEHKEPEDPEPRKFTTRQLAEAFRLIYAGFAKLKEQDPNTERFTKVYRAVSENISCYKAIYDEKKRKDEKTTLNTFIKNLTTVTCCTPPGSESNLDSPEPSPSY